MPVGLGWIVHIQGSPKDVQVVPVDDLREHEISKDCWCRPVQDPDDPWLYGHNALDQRDKYEKDSPDAHANH